MKSEYTETDCEQAEEQQDAVTDGWVNIESVVRSVIKHRCKYSNRGLDVHSVYNALAGMKDNWNDLFAPSDRECEETITSFRGAQEREHEATESRAIRSIL